VTSVPVVDCSTAHDEEVIGEVDLEAGPWPGDAKVEKAARTACTPLFARYVGIPLDRSSYDVGSYYPSQEAWSSGDRRATCLIETDRTTTGSLKGSRS
jgi:hypothetical protein